MKLMSEREVGLWREGAQALALRDSDAIQDGRKEDKKVKGVTCHNFERAIERRERDTPPTSEFERGREVGE